MKTVKVCLLLLLIVDTIVLVNASDEVEMAALFGVGVGFVGGLAWLTHYTWYLYHCDPDWISFDADGLKAELDRKLFGQHIASHIILSAVKGFMRDENPKKPLVLSLHGPTGTGKNFASEMIAKNVYREGMKSSFVHVYSSTLHFPHKNKVDTYKSQLQQSIKKSVSSCGRSIFIFDEMDKMPPGLIDSLIPYLDYHDELDGVSYRRAIFIFLSNAGAESITETALDFWKRGQHREEIKLTDLESSVSISAFNKKNSGFQHSGLIQNKLVDIFVPFLPLERLHVVQCVLAEMEARRLGPNLDVAYKLADELVYMPKPDKAFSSVGCKTIGKRLNMYLD